MSKDSVFLSGWEYNRLLADDPTTPIQSALPGSALWNGGAQFWLFKTVYCTKESLDGEIEASEALGYAQGKIFSKLEAEGFLKPIAWASLKQTAPHVYESLCSGHQTLKAQFPREALNEIVRNGKANELDEIKLRLMAPLLRHFRCVQNISPNSVQHWLTSEQQTRPSNEPPPGEVVERLARPLKRDEGTKLGVTVCNRPGSHGVTMAEILAQKEIERTIEKQQIGELFMGSLSSRNYLGSLAPYAAVYQPINKQLLADWESNCERLFRLRDLAEKHVWKNLHNEWLPRLEAEPAFQSQFVSLIKRAVRQSEMPAILDLLTALGVFIVGWAASEAAGRVGIEPNVATGLGAASGLTLKNRAQRLTAQTEGLSLFYQDARRVICKTEN